MAAALQRELNQVGMGLLALDVLAAGDGVDKSPIPVSWR
jgi:hypothetical protein